MGEHLLDELKRRHRCRNDAALARKLGCAKGTISKVRAGKIKEPRSLMARIMETFNTPLLEIDHLLNYSEYDSIDQTLIL